MRTLTVPGIPALIKQIDAGRQPKYDYGEREWTYVDRDKPKAMCKVHDGDGLYLVHKPGTHSTRWSYRYTWHGEKYDFPIGPIRISLADARKKRRACERLLDDGLNPRQVRDDERKAEIERRNKDKHTFSGMVWDWSTHYHEREDLADTTKARNDRILKYLEADLGSTPVASLTQKSILKSVTRIKSDNGKETAVRAVSLCHLFAEHLVVRELLSGDPTVGIRRELGKLVDKPRSAIIDPAKVGELLRAVWNYPGHAGTVAAMKLLPLTMLRPGELRKSNWNEINFDTGEWIIPQSRMKTRNTHPIDHLVPMSKQVVKILKDLKALELHDTMVFPSLRGRCLSENAFRVALLNLGYDGDTHHAHGWRKTAGTLLQKLNYEQRWIDKQLAHAVPGVSGKYQLYDYAAERKKMLQQWATYCDQLRKGANVVAIGSKGVA